MADEEEEVTGGLGSWSPGLDFNQNIAANQALLSKERGPLAQQMSALENQYLEVLRNSVDDDSISPGQAFGRMLAAGLPVLIAGAAGGMDAAGEAGNFAAANLLEQSKRDELRADKKKALELETIGTQMKRLEKKDTNYQKRSDKLLEMAAAPSKAGAEAEAKLPYDLAKAAAGRSSNITNVKLPATIDKDLLKEMSDADAMVALLNKNIQEMAKFKGDSRFNFQLKNKISATDQGKAMIGLDSLGAMIVKMTQGSRPSDFDMKMFLRMVKGDITANASDIQELLGRMRDQIVLQQNMKRDWLNKFGAQLQGGDMTLPPVKTGNAFAPEQREILKNSIREKMSGGM